MPFETDPVITVRVVRKIDLSNANDTYDDTTTTPFGAADYGYGSEIYGYNGDDTIDGYGGDDIIYGGFGNDQIKGGNDEDRLYGE